MFHISADDDHVEFFEFSQQGIGQSRAPPSVNVLQWLHRTYCGFWPVAWFMCTLSPIYRLVALLISSNRLSALCPCVGGGGLFFPSVRPLFLFCCVLFTSLSCIDRPVCSSHRHPRHVDRFVCRILRCPRFSMGRGPIRHRVLLRKVETLHPDAQRCHVCHGLLWKQPPNLRWTPGAERLSRF